VGLSQALRDGVVVLDGGLATELEARGHDISGDLWSARLLHDEPEAIVDAHLGFLRAGASVVTTASYQASVAGFARHGYDDPARLLRRSVTLAREAIGRARDDGAGRPLWVAASVGPYGAVLADGSEYRGDYGLTEAQLRRFHGPRLRVLADAGPDVLAIETIPDIREASAIVAELDGVGVPAWLSFSVHGGQTRAGQPLADALTLAAAPGIIAVGVNCSTPADVGAAIPVAAASGKPVVAYPNSGEEWDPVGRRWTGSPALGEPLTRWVADGARLIGGCCRVTPSHVTTIATTLASIMTYGS
jgi:homocysteine S-methyltransferase